MTDLKPCPFCGSENPELRTGYEDTEPVPVVRCKSCGAYGPWGDPDGVRWNAALRLQSEPQEETKAIPTRCLSTLLTLTEEGFSPAVPFNQDNSIMLLDAYEARGRTINRVITELRSMLNLEKKP